MGMPIGVLPVAWDCSAMPDETPIVLVAVTAASAFPALATVLWTGPGAGGSRAAVERNPASHCFPVYGGRVR